ncbi:ABC-three component system middle component 5 [Sphingomonas sp.]|uniref:ABC-three component system middle component 5 n=1 Tax=Sphingomonas sp. TaxID=28214 RepID=UPI003CC6B382
MTQLVYHPALDPYNALLRACRTLASSQSGLDVTALRILDFLLVFPEKIVAIRLSPALRAASKRLKAEPRFPYDRSPSSQALFRRMGAPFEAAVQTMISRGLAKVGGASGKLTLDPEAVPAEMLALARGRNDEEPDLMSLLASLGAEYPSQGPNGLKDRSGLAEFRYDVV